jgi:light-regulated signal transduction histidine kinase (bacteriophytochrome)
MGKWGAIIGRRSNGEEFPIEASISQLAVAGQKRYTAIVRDITERQRMEDTLHLLNAELERRVQQRTAQLEAANQELEAFAYSVSHDLRAPLRHIDGFVNLLARRQTVSADATAMRYMRIISDSMARLGQLIDDLLAFSRTSRAELQMQRVDLHALVQEVQQELAPAMAQRHVTWEIDSLPVVKGDPVLLRLVWTNLLANALKYTTPRPQARITIGALCSEHGERTLFVQDNGVGFDMQYAHKLFGVFQRLHRHEEFSGTGIGLAIVRRIIQRHGGRVWAEGAVDHGATFFFTLHEASEA